MAWKVPWARKPIDDTGGIIYADYNTVQFPDLTRNLDFVNPQLSGYPYQPVEFNKLTDLPSARQAVSTNTRPRQR